MNVVQSVTPAIGAADCVMAGVFARQKEAALRLRSSTPAERIGRLKQLEAAIQAHRGAIYQALAADLRKPEAETDLGEILPVISEIHHAVKHLRAWMRPRRVMPTLAMLGTGAKIRPEPKGVCLIIAPWNYPINLAFGPLVCAIAAGNTVMLKPSELTPATSALTAEIVRKTFDPAEVAVFEGDAGVATALLALPFDHIFFTGSPAVGKVVMAAAAKHLTSVTLELGGKSPVIVDETANLSKAAASIVWGKFSNNGQTCVAPDYLYVQQSVLSDLVEKMKAQIAKMYGADVQASPDYCRIVNARHFGRITAMIAEATAKGAIVIAGGASAAEQNYISPTLMTGAPADSAVMEEEIFGPVLPIIPFSSIDGPISQINARPKPLALYVFSKNSATVEKIIAETSSGGAAINTTVLQFLHNNLPFGGVNNSGIGSSHGVYGFKAFSHERAVLRDHASVTPMLFPPYTRTVRLMIKSTLKYFA